MSTEPTRFPAVSPKKKLKVIRLNEDVFTGHLFCFDCLTRMRGSYTFGHCPFCRVRFAADDIRWLYFNYEYDTFSHQPQYTSSTESLNRQTLPQWLIEAKLALEERITVASMGRSDVSQQEVERLSSDVQEWLFHYHQCGLPSNTVSGIVILMDLIDAIFSSSRKTRH